MKHIIFIILLISTTIIACSKKKIEKTTASKLEKTTPVTIKETSPEVQIQPKSVTEAQIMDNNDVNLVAKIKRTPCFGKCPVFTVELYNNGVVKYNGVAFVDKKGAFTTNVYPEFIKKIQNKALSIKYLSLENKYPIAAVAIADLPVTTTFIRIGDVSKQISDNFDAPRELIEFENWLEREFDKLAWKAE